MSQNVSQRLEILDNSIGSQKSQLIFKSPNATGSVFEPVAFGILKNYLYINIRFYLNTHCIRNEFNILQLGYQNELMLFSHVALFPYRLTILDSNWENSMVYDKYK